ARGQAQQLANARHGGVAVLLGVLRQQLGGRGGAVGAARHDVGERAPTVNPELPLHSVLEKGKNGAARAAAGREKVIARWPRAPPGRTAPTGRAGSWPIAA